MIHQPTLISRKKTREIDSKLEALDRSTSLKIVLEELGEQWWRGILNRRKGTHPEIGPSRPRPEPFYSLHCSL